MNPEKQVSKLEILTITRACPGMETSEIEAWFRRELDQPYPAPASFTRPDLLPQKQRRSGLVMATRDACEGYVGENASSVEENPFDATLDDTADMSVASSVRRASHAVIQALGPVAP